MEFLEGKEKFLQAWGTLGSDWGINRTMAQIHALLMISPYALTSDEVMEELKISRGNANMNLRSLLDWGLVHKVIKQGDRKEYFEAEKDMWTVVKQIMTNRKKRELEPIIKLLDELSIVQAQDNRSQEFVNVVRDLKMFTGKADGAIESLMKADSSWFLGTFLRMIR